MRMKNRLKQLSVCLAIAMTVGAFASVAAAQDQSSSTVQPTPVPMAEQNQTPAPTGSPEPTTQPTPEPTPAAGEPFVSSYELRNASGNLGNLVRDKNNDIIPTGTLTVTIVDPRLDVDKFQVTDVRLMPQNGQNFSAIEGTVVKFDNKNNSYTVQFNGLQYLGGDNTFKFDISYDSSYALPITSLSVSLPQCYTIEKNGTESGAQLRAPGLIVKEFSFGGASVPAGSPFTLNLTVFATSGDQNLSDVTVSLALPENVTMANGNSSVYVGSMSPESSKQISFEILPSANLTGGVASLQLSMSGVGASDGTKSEGTATVTVPVVQPERFEITKVQGAETLMAGEEGLLEVTFVNKGKEAISNLSAEINGEKLRNPGQSQYLGNVQPGTENTVEFTIASDTEGTITGMVTLTYENSAGQTKTITKEYSCTVQPAMDMGGDMGGMEMPIEPMPEPQSGVPVWVWIVAVVGVLAVGGVAAVIILKKQKAKKLAQLEAEDDDEDI